MTHTNQYIGNIVCMFMNSAYYHLLTGTLAKTCWRKVRDVTLTVLKYASANTSKLYQVRNNKFFIFINFNGQYKRKQSNAN